MKRILGYLLFLSLITSCKDKGSFDVSGYLIDTCNGEALVNAEVMVYFNGATKSVYSNQEGYFRITGEWSEQRSSMHKDIKCDYFLFMPNSKERVILGENYGGNYFLGDFILRNQVQFPILIDDSNNPCPGCTFSLYLTNGLDMMAFQTSQSGIVEIATFIGPMSYDRQTGQASSFSELQLRYHNGSQGVLKRLDVAQYIKRCDLGDTLKIVL
jgi:hypothetical protein